MLRSGVVVLRSGVVEAVIHKGPVFLRFYFYELSGFEIARRNGQY
jgi:hypothetical protein